MQELTLKIKKITTENFKALYGQKEILLEGSSIIVTGKNDAGKTSFLRGLIDRFKGIYPEKVVNKNAEKGTYVMELTNGEKIEWRFTEKSEQINLYTSNGLKISSGVLTYLENKYFGKSFDIKEFFSKTDKEKTKYILNLLNIDVSHIDLKYKETYEERSKLNSELKAQTGLNLSQPIKVDFVDVDNLQKKLQNIRKSNKLAEEKWEKEQTEHLSNIEQFNKKQDFIELQYNNLIKLGIDFTELKSKLLDFGFKGSDSLFKEIEGFINSFQKPKERKEIKSLPKPTYASEDEILLEITNAEKNNILADSYEKELKKFSKWEETIKDLKQKSDEKTALLKSYIEEKEKLLASANIPEEFSIVDDTLLYKGLPFTEAQISTSGLYIAALKLGYIGLGLLKTAHIDAAALDNDNLNDILKWATQNDLQLLVELPNREQQQEGFTYKLISNME